MKLTFLGTRGGITSRSSSHYNHSILLIQYYKTKILIDCGQDWKNKIFQINPEAIFLTHAHPDHVGGLINGAPCDVYATKIIFDKIKNYKIFKKVIVSLNKAISIGKFFIEAFDVEHSINAPAIGYKISAGKNTIFYVPDLVYIVNEKEALSNVKVYIGDGAIVNRKILIKKRDSKLIGHAPILEQIKWCKKNNINYMIITHCGSEIVNGDEGKIKEKIKKLEKEYNIKIKIAYDNMKLKI